MGTAGIVSYILQIGILVNTGLSGSFHASKAGLIQLCLDYVRHSNLLPAQIIMRNT